MSNKSSLPTDGDERTLLSAFLDFHRDTAVATAGSLTDEQARIRHVSSASTVLGMLQHMIETERYWFRAILAGDGYQTLMVSPIQDAEWQLSDDRTLDQVISEYLEACAESRAISESMSLEAVSGGARRNGDRPSHRWILLHMVEETAQHNGQLDILVELTLG